MIIAILLFASLTLAIGVLSYRYPWWRANLPDNEPRILCYHMIDDRQKTDRAPRLAVSPAAFERQIRYLSRRGWRFVTMSELIAAPAQEKTVALTFDDGYRDNLTNAAPILQRYDACGTVYVIADRSNPLAGGGHEDGTPFAPLLSDDELRSLAASGVFEIGSHTVCHQDLTQADAAKVQLELTRSREILEDLISAPVRSFAYPYGAFSESLIPAVQSAGYEHAVRGGAATGHLTNDRYRLGRIRISGKDSFLNFVFKIRKGRKR